ncbi:hypothetical protein [Amycolatopsis magusensis]|uniref:hypothetical protein n=1 Tax=Amycolatopsis magusensis TaxID=882444 RepID=UPI0037A02F47
MTTATPIAITQELVDEIRDRLSRSPLSPLTVPQGEPPKYTNGPGQRAYVQNVYSAINTTGMKKAAKDLPMGPPPRTLWSAERLTAAVRADEDRTPPRTDPVTIGLAGKTLEVRRKEWLGYAKQIAEVAEFYGYCNSYATATVAILVADNSPLATGTSVEFVGSGDPATGHMFVVVNRATGSDINDSGTWGPDFIVVDYWYALQKGVNPVFWSKAPTDDYTDFIYFMSHQGKDGTQSVMRLYGEFTAKAYKPFSVKPLAKGKV